ncbi:MAG: hypothetical protein P8R42_18930 [Candidatus Binatia bacterium]|nr:hypothetical protein [Candidatus Binatia bacterium]
MGCSRRSVQLRAPWRGQLGLHHHQWLTASTLLFSKNWYREGVVPLRMMMLEEPRSGEAQGIADRSPYVSFPPGAVVPVYLLARVTGQEPSASSIMALGLANQLGILLLLAATALVSLRALGVSGVWRLVLGGVPPFLYLYAPAPFYFHQNVYFADQAVILPFALVLFLEARRMAGRTSTAADVAMAGALFWGAFTDWLFLPIAASLWLVRLFGGDLGRGLAQIVRRSAILFAPVVLALGLFAVQLVAAGQLDTLSGRFGVVAGLGGGVPPSFGELAYAVFVTQVDSGYGSSALVAIAVGIALAVFLVTRLLGSSSAEASGEREGADRLTGVALVVRLLVLATLPCVIYAMVVPIHTVGHDFSALKLGPTLALGPFCLIPAAVVRFAERSFSAPRLRWVLVLPVAVALWHFSAADRRSSFPEPWEALPELAAFFEEHVGWEDAVFSPDFVIRRHPPHLLAYTMKRVRVASSLRDVQAWAAENSGHPGPFVLVSIDPDGPGVGAYAEALRVREVGAIRWARLSRSELDRLMGAEPLPVRSPQALP